ncbi:2OG-Fe dioxygenase family protein [Streptomyces sp. NPDC008150]|uniref:2OG-Fe dioxygenase family protein n=1 Tax=Streptomyces sp. NPDC008150 TaxID=3364816 RepID=UPI0036EF8A03
MHDAEHVTAERIAEPAQHGLSAYGWVFVRGEQIAPEQDSSPLRSESCDAWGTLPLDPYAPPGTGRYRRYGRWVWLGSSLKGAFRGTLRPAPHRPYRQAREFNALAGDTDREFPPLPQQIRESPLVRRLLYFDLAAAGAWQGRWRVDVHMVRIAPDPEGSGQPAPEGVHRDGLDVIGIHLIEVSGLEGGVSSVFDAAGKEVATVRLRHHLDSLLVDDRRLWHFTSALRAAAPGTPPDAQPTTRPTGRRTAQPVAGPTTGWRDVLLVGLQRSDRATEAHPGRT